MYNIHLLPAQFGDAILIEYGSVTTPKYILIDGGPYFGFDEMTTALNKVAPKLKQLELLVVTHIDIDHIDGIITLLNLKKQPFKIKEIWFNGWDQLKPIKTGLLGPLQGEYLSNLIREKVIPHNKSFNGKAVMVTDPSHLPMIKLPGKMELTLLSPHLDALKKLKNTWKKEITKITSAQSIEARWDAEKRYIAKNGVLGSTPPHPDVSVANMSSIAFIATHDKKSCLFAGDTMTNELLKSIEPLCAKHGVEQLTVDAWKLAHHGSQKSTMKGIIDKVSATHILISTNGARYKHPDKACITSLLKANGKGLKLHFNYLSQQNKYWSGSAPAKKFGYTANFAKSKFGIKVEL